MVLVRSSLLTVFDFSLAFRYLVTLVTVENSTVVGFMLVLVVLAVFKVTVNLEKKILSLDVEYVSADFSI